MSPGCRSSGRWHTSSAGARHVFTGTSPAARTNAWSAAASSRTSGTARMTTPRGASTRRCSRNAAGESASTAAAP